MTNREAERLRGWIADVCADQQCGLASFAAGLITDLDAIVFGMSTEWSSGPVEGRVNDLKGPRAQHVRQSETSATAQAASPDRGQPPTLTSGASGLVIQELDQSRLRTQ